MADIDRPTIHEIHIKRRLHCLQSYLSLRSLLREKRHILTLQQRHQSYHLLRPLLRTVLKGPDKRNPHHYYYYVTSPTTHSSLYFVTFVKDLIKDIDTKSIATLNCPTTPLTRVFTSYLSMKDLIKELDISIVTPVLPLTQVFTS